MGEGKIKLHSNQYFGVCAVGGILSCGITHTMITPLDLVKCQMQTGVKYKHTLDGLSQMSKKGLPRLFTGWGPTAAGYSAQGVNKFGWYEYFKYKYAKMAGSNADKYRTFLYMGASASAEFLADIALCPFEAVKVRVQTQEGFAKGLMDGMPKIVAAEGVGGLFKGLVPLWSRQIPYTIVKFTAFERIVTALYANCFTKPRDEYNKLQQLGVSFLAGYSAGVFCAVVSHPADVIVSKLNKTSGGSFMGIASELGFSGMWTGLAPRIVMIGTLTALQWLIFDYVKTVAGLPTTGKVEKK